MKQCHSRSLHTPHSFTACSWLLFCGLEKCPARIQREWELGESGVNIGLCVQSVTVFLAWILSIFTRENNAERRFKWFGMFIAG